MGRALPRFPLTGPCTSLPSFIIDSLAVPSANAIAVAIAVAIAFVSALTWLRLWLLLLLLLGMSLTAMGMACAAGPMDAASLCCPHPSPSQG